MVKYTEEFLQEIAESKGGNFVEFFYVGRRKKATFNCSEGHEWSTEPSHIVSTWCRQCDINSRKHTIEKMQVLAAKNGGECLSDEYVNVETKLLWKCSAGHEFESVPHSILKGCWCMQCYNDRRIPTQDIVDELAVTNGGLCLSEYKDSYTPILWQCAKGHQWEVDYNHVQQGTWCPECNLSKIPTQDDVNALAARSGGKCLSAYKNNKTQMKWQCSNKHVWESTYSHIQQGSWCPKCRAKTEQYCRSIFECLFNSEFPNTRPDWLLNEEGNKLELDGYNKNLKIAFEYNGRQHYEIVEHWEGSDEKLQKQQEHDRIKKEECSNRGIILIVIPYTLTTKKQIRAFIYEELFYWTLEDYSDDNLTADLLKN